MTRWASFVRLAGLCTAIGLVSAGFWPGESWAQGEISQTDEEADKAQYEAAKTQADVLALCQLVEANYAYLEGREAIWSEACETGAVDALDPQSHTPAGRVALLERMIDQLHDNHISLNTNTSVSPRLVPSGSDYFLALDGDRAMVTAVRPKSGAASAGLQVGDEVIAINGVPIADAAFERIQAARDDVSAERYSWAMNAQAAGYRGAARRVQVRRDGDTLTLDLGDPEPQDVEKLVTYAVLPGNVGYIRFEDSLGEAATVAEFDEALDMLRGVGSWIIDLRNTPGGGNTGTAEPILGRFIRGVKPYQRSGPRWHGDEVRYVSSRGPWRVRGRVAVLAGHWTGSMGEGMAMGFDGLRRGRVFGSDMAKLAGGVEAFELPGSGISVRFPAYDLLHVRGGSRHHWHPPYRVLADNGDGPDFALNEALAWVRR